MTKRAIESLVDSEIQWVGLIPNNWATIRLKNAVEGCYNGVWGDEPEGGVLDVPCIRVADFDRNQAAVSLRKLTLRKIDLPASSQRFLKKGDLLIEKSGGGELSPVGNVVIYDHDLKAVCSNFVGRMPVRIEHCSHYWKYVFQAIYATQLNTCSIKQNTGIQNLDTSQYLDERAPSPDLCEQRQIAAYLNRETAKIDHLISKQERLIELLQEKRQAVISRAVTKGLDPNVKMKDSGVEWLGAVPDGFNVVSLTRYVPEIVDYRGRTPTKSDEGVYLLTARNIRRGFIDYACSEEYILESEYDDAMRRGKPALGDVLFTMEAPLGNVAMVDRIDVAIAQRVIKFRVDTEFLVGEYLMFSILSTWFQSQLESLATGSTALGLKASKLNQLRIAVPDLATQRYIIEYLNEELIHLDSVKSKALRQIDLLREHRQALISAAVTGKIDVRELVTDEEVAALDTEPEELPSEDETATYMTEEEQG